MRRLAAAVSTGIAAVALVSRAASAQVPASSHALFIMGGGDVASLSEMNRTLGDQRYTQFDQGAFGIGGGAYFTRRRLLVGGEGEWLTWGQKSTDAGTVKTTLHAAYGLVDFGYLYKRIGSTLVYPMIGVGGGQTRFAIGWSQGQGLGPGASNPTFEEVLNNPGSH